MNDQDLIRRAKMAWHTDETWHIALPIYSTDGTHLLDIPFYKEKDEWVGRIIHEDMVRLVKTAEALRKEVKDGQI